MTIEYGEQEGNKRDKTRVQTKENYTSRRDTYRDNKNPKIIMPSPRRHKY